AVWLHPACRKQQLSLRLSTISALGLGIPALPLPKRQLLPAAPVWSAEDPDVHGVPSVSNHRGHPPYPRSSSFPWPVSSQEYSHAPLPSAPAMSQSLQSLSMRDWIDASQSHRHTDFYSLYG
ncbi:hypothetical protein M9458_024673, partial [Cirrhinus mrigala]